MPSSQDPDYALLFSNNQRWVDRTNSSKPGFFQSLAQQQAPKYFWVGCSDSRVPANEVIDLAPGEVFVHRNVANVVPHSDLNALSTLQFAVDVLRVEHILVVGHYGCGGIKAVLDNTRVGLADNWLGHVGDVMERHLALLDSLPDAQTRHDRLCELNALEQAHNICRSTVLQDAWARHQRLTVHACVYGLKDGLLHDLGFNVREPHNVITQYAHALDGLRQAG